MNFIQRLGRFSIGVIIGMVLVYMFFNGKLNLFSSWTPQNRVKARISESYYMSSEHSDCLLACSRLEWDSLTSMIQVAEVDFSASQTKNEPKEFQLEMDYLEKRLKVRFAVADSSVWLVDYKGTQACECH